MKRIALVFLSFFELVGCSHLESNLPKDVERGLISVAEKYYKAYNNRDIQGQVNLMADHVTYISNSGKVRTGKEAYFKYTEDLYTEVNEKAVDLVYFVDLSKNVVIAQGKVVGTYDQAAKGMPPAKGQSYILPFVEIFEIQNGQVTKFFTYYNEELWKQQISQTKK